MNDSTSNGSLAFGEFLEHLRRQGFAIGVDHHLRLQELLNRISAHCAPSDLKTFLCPIFATNKKQQDQFYSAFDSYFDLFQPVPSEEQSTPGRAAIEWYPLVLKGYEPVVARKWPYVLAGTLLLILIVVAASFISPRHPEPKSISPPEIAQTPPESESQPQVEQTPPSPTSKVEQPEVEQTEPAPAPSLEPELSFYQRYGKAIRLTVVLAPLIFFLFYEWYRFNRRKLVLQKQRGQKPPYVWPMRVEAHTPKLYDSEEFYTAARLMRRRQVDEFRRLDVNATIAATIESLGYPKFRYRPDSKPPEYLALIDRASFRDHQAQLFNELVNALEQEGIFIGRYFYDGDPRVCCSEKGDCFHLEELHDRHAGHRLLIFGDGEKIIDPITGKLESWAAVFLEWQDRAVLTPEPPGQWGLREITLASEFILLPAKVDALLVVVDQFESSVAGDLRIWRENGSDTPPRELGQPGVVEALRKYLGEETFQWLCACAVYPELQWDLTLYMASLPCMEDGLVKEKNLLQLTRLPYFRSGTVPDDLRWRLISELDRDKEKAIRSAIINLLEKNPPPKETFAAETYQLNLVVQRWLYRRSRKTRREMLRVLRASPPSRVARDYTLLRFLESPRASPLDLLLPRRLRSLFYRDGIPAFGLKTSARFLVTLVFVALAWIVVKPPASPKPSDQTADNPTSITDVSPIAPPPAGMILAIGGKFMRGNPKGDQYEIPVKEEVVSPFYIDQYEVTNWEYYKFTADTKYYRWPNDWSDSWKAGKFAFGEFENPVAGVTWNDAQNYAKWAGKRLPTEVEWEYAARGSNGWLYPWGNDFKPNYANIGTGGLTRVDAFPNDKSPLGVIGMAGNVSEWTSSLDESKPGKIIVRGANYLPPSQLKMDVSPADFARVTRRLSAAPENGYAYIGIRCVKDARGIAPVAPPVTVTAETQERNVSPQPSKRFPSSNPTDLAVTQNRNVSTSTTQATSTTTGTLVGQVFDEAGQPIAGVKVTITNIDSGNSVAVLTDGTGWFRRPFLFPGNYRVTASKRGFTDNSIEASVPLNSITEIKPPAITIHPATVAVVNLVVKSEPGAEIYIDGAIAGKTTDKGELRIPYMKPGQHTISAKKDNFNHAERAQTFSIGDAVVDLKLEPAANSFVTTGAIEGRVVDLTGGIVPGARVSVINEENGLERSTITDSKGRFFLALLPPGYYKVTVSKTGYLDWSITNFKVQLKINLIVAPVTLRSATGPTQTSGKSKKPGSK